MKTIIEYCGSRNQTKVVHTFLRGLHKKVIFYQDGDIEIRVIKQRSFGLFETIFYRFIEHK